MKDARGCVLSGRWWVEFRECRCVVVSVGWERNGAKPLGDWVVTNAIERVSGANGAASRFSVTEVNTDKETAAGNDGWRDKSFESAT